MSLQSSTGGMERAYRPRPGYRGIAASVTDPGWLSPVPRDLPTFVVAKGLTMYLPAAEGPLLLRRLVAHLCCGEMAFDTNSRLGVRSVSRIPAVRRSGAHLDWAVNDPRSLERKVPGTTRRRPYQPFCLRPRAQLTSRGTWVEPATSGIPVTRSAGQYPSAVLILQQRGRRRTRRSRSA
jgi:O-methyltransferase involved in polyketide biosynthesis